MATALTTPILIQTKLSELGIYTGALDGIIGPKTKAAIRGFQRMHKLSDDGIVGPKTYAQLFPTLIADRLDLGKPKASKTSPWPHQSECLKFYGPVGQNQTSLVLPYELKLAWDLRVAVKKVSVHEKTAASCGRVLTRILDHYGPTKIASLKLDIWGGTLNVRKMRGGNSWSMHSWGIAWDFDPQNNQLRWGKDKATFAKPVYEKFWKIWEEEGWISLGRVKNFDWMHVQAARV